MAHARRLQVMLAALVVGAGLGSTSGARADVDMTAVWKIVITHPVPLTAYETFVQTGTALAMSHPDDPPTSIPGTIDPVSGEFDLQFGPAMQSGVPDPGPDVVRTGIVAPDGQSFTATQRFCLWDFEWRCLDIAMTGTRTDIVCGDGELEGDEECDLGVDNGGACCTAVCGMVDPDQDDVCATDDNCPDVRNPAQDDWDDDGLGNPCDETPEGHPSDPLALSALKLTTKPAATISKLKLTGTTTGVLGEPDFLRLVDAGGKEVIVSNLRGWATKVCSERGLRLKCKSPDGLALTMSAKPSAPTSLKVQLSLNGAPIGPPFAAPVTFTMLHAGGAHTGVLSNCKTSGAGSINCRP